MNQISELERLTQRLEALGTPKEMVASATKLQEPELQVPPFKIFEDRENDTENLPPQANQGPQNLRIYTDPQPRLPNSEATRDFSVESSALREIPLDVLEDIDAKIEQSDAVESTLPSTVTQLDTYVMSMIEQAVLKAQRKRGRTPREKRCGTTTATKPLRLSPRIQAGSSKCYVSHHEPDGGPSEAFELLEHDNGQSTISGSCPMGEDDMSSYEPNGSERRNSVASDGCFAPSSYVAPPNSPMSTTSDAE